MIRMRPTLNSITLDLKIFQRLFKMGFFFFNFVFLIFNFYLLKLPRCGNCYHETSIGGDSEDTKYLHLPRLLMQ